MELRGKEYMFASNNWLKQHGLPMRRKPFKRVYMCMDELPLQFTTEDREELLALHKICSGQLT